MQKIILNNKYWVNNKIKFKKIEKDKFYNIKIEENVEPCYLSYIDNKNKFNINYKYINVKFNAMIEENIKAELFVVGYKKEKKELVQILDIKYSKLINVENIDEVRFMLRVVGKGDILVKEISIEFSNDDEIVKSYKGERSQNEYLVLTNVYPSYCDLYRNGFVHRRIKGYMEEGINVDVFSMRGKGEICTYEFDGVNVFEGNKNSLVNFLENSKYKKILIHFIDKDMYEAIQMTVPNTKLIVWIHGVETEKWYRRIFNITNDKEAEIAISKLEDNYKRLKFMNEIYSRNDRGIKFIFVSKWFKEEVAEVDAKAKVIEKNYEIIPNIIDSEVFNYVKKDDDQRYNILTIRPFASRKYANDLSVKAILDLSQKSYFNKLDIAIYGAGKLFDETLRPIRHFENVHIYKRFLKQEEIAELHKKYGIFLCPTRLDSQGVSMCEAMSSGLVPISSNTTAIPEFVLEECGILAEPENYKGLVDGVDYLINNPDKFQEYSKNSSRRMKRLCSKECVITKEIKIITE